MTIINGGDSPWFSKRTNIQIMTQRTGKMALAPLILFAKSTMESKVPKNVTILSKEVNFAMISGAFNITRMAADAGPKEMMGNPWEHSTLIMLPGQLIAHSIANNLALAMKTTGVQSRCFVSHLTLI